VASADTDRASDRPDPEAAELHALIEMEGFVRYAKEARELQERERDEAEREREAWEKYEAAVEATITVKERLSLYFVISLGFFVSVVVMVVELMRGLL